MYDGVTVNGIEMSPSDVLQKCIEIASSVVDKYPMSQCATNNEYLKGSGAAWVRYEIKQYFKVD